jgi:ATP-dependent DNA ligase
MILLGDGDMFPVRDHVPAKYREYPLISICLREKRRSRCGQGLTAEGMKKCVWVRPELVAQIEFLEYTQIDYLRHSKFVGLRDDKDPRSVVKEHSCEA